MLSIFFVGNINASIYSNNTSKNSFVLVPGMIAYEKGLNDTDGVGGVDFRIKNNVILPSYSVSSGEESGSFDDVKKKDRISYYIVQAGDNVGKIAEKFKISKNTIIWENNLTSKGFLKLKQKLTILPVSGVSYSVKKGDSLEKIANNFTGDIDEIKIFNDLKDDSLKIGEKIIIPNGKIIPKKKKVVEKVTKVVKKTKSSSPVKYKKSNNELSSFFKRPTSGRTTSLYGKRWSSFHHGIDYAGSRGSNVVAAASGTIVKAYSGCRVGNAKCGGGYGNNIEILHSNGLKTRYAHLHNVIVKKGQKVVSGQLIGGMGNTGHVYPRPRTISSTAGTHLHFEILRGSSRINPNFLR